MVSFCRGKALSSQKLKFSLETLKHGFKVFFYVSTASRSHKEVFINKHIQFIIKYESLRIIHQMFKEKTKNNVVNISELDELSR